MFERKSDNQQQKTAASPTKPTAAKPERGQTDGHYLFQMQQAFGNRATQRLLTALPQPQAGGEPLPTNLRKQAEALGHQPLDDVQVHYNAPQPAALGALAYAQGNHIFIGQGQRRHLPHELWHVVQQKQNRVNAQIQFKQGGINLDPRLEREANRMGRLLQHHDDSSRLASPAADWRFRTAVSPTASPAPIIQGLFETEGLNSFKAFLEKQREDQKALSEQTPQKISNAAPKLEKHSNTTEKKEAPQEVDNNGEKYTTVGFEYEFATMKDGPLRGFSHLEVAKGNANLPHPNVAKVPFLLETDTRDALELVTAPFFFRTPPQNPIPIPEDVEKFDQLMNARLEEIIAKGDTTLEKVISHFKKDGINFTLNQIKIEAHHLTPNSLSGVGNEQQAYNRFFPKVNAPDLNKITLTERDKESQSKKFAIKPHINIATDASTYNRLESIGLESADYKNRPIERFYHLLQQSIFQKLSQIKWGKISAPFLQLLAKKLSGLAAIDSINNIRKLQDHQFAKVKVNERPTENWESNPFHRNMLSTVKDIHDVWLKDTVANFFPQEMLSEAQNQENIGKIFQGVRKIEVNSLIDQITDLDFSEGIPKSFAEDFMMQVQAQLSLLQNHMPAVKSVERPEFLRDHPKELGVRQDTFINADKVQLPDIWPDKKLHVVELRSDAIALLKKLSKQ